ncbi:hypothetical protein [Paraburkholderia ginsengiterrae]|nr:hypothetical protein [Paraburkholderia ginsengiterrae]
MKMKNWIATVCFGVLSSQSAFACTPPLMESAYFGSTEMMSEELTARIREDVRKNHYTVIEYRVGSSYFPLVKKGDTVYLNGKPLAKKEDSFWYLGHGFYQFNHEVFFMDEHIGAYPTDGTVIAYEEDRSATKKPDTWPANSMWCSISVHANKLEASNGLRFEKLVYDN